MRGLSLSGLYLHIPFCEHKCLYCDFYSIEHLDGIEQFCSALTDEIGLYEEYGGAETVTSVFFGGGTPSLLTPAQLERILRHLHSRFRIDPSCEVTLEANPGTIDGEKLHAYRSLGINRLSIGVQSFHEDELRFLTRIHDAAEAREAVRRARRAGFDNVNIDLIFALPSQTAERWRSNIREAIGLGVEHISAYNLIVEQGTPLARMVSQGLVAVPPTELEAEMYLWTIDALRSAGYAHYEVSNYARSGYQCRHNLAYWRHENYLGFGPSAHSFRDRRRWWNIANLRTYLDALSSGRAPVAGSEHLTPGQIMDESLMLSLRTGELDLRTIGAGDDEERTRRLDDRIRRWESDGMLVREDHVVRLTDRGFLYCDEIVRLLLPETAPV
ncbi:MAG TPA: radical SAM family heme chaperone HemW [Bacteroidota bacterium]|nr:radical SAM family heme chaperone HemW [Bacteroidota bacterium]